jgi:glutamate-1-semialdehyde 2,1-aminomutase
VAAGLATLRLLEDGSAYRRLEELGAYLEAGLAAAPCTQVVRAGSLLWPYLGDGPPPRRADAIPAQQAERFAPLHAGLLRRGFYLPPSAYEVLFLSTAHTEADLDPLIAAWRQEIELWN